ncbi:MAG: NAD-dependent epimerase/dehydratase family protein [Planctomycetota bacterium]|jgi:nucleoside-diphosphate-sugar epimerase|nr:NAD-dependent epimerase/dehydratase family protein [Planctomycetota bacterium]
MEGRLLITGASGFVGQALVDACQAAGIAWLGQASGLTPRSPAAAPPFIMANLAEDFDWTPHLKGVGAVVHLAGVAHTNIGQGEARERMRRINVQAAADLAEQAVAGKIPRFVFVSSQHAGSWESGDQGVGFYGEAKKDAEEAIRKRTAGSLTSLAILRPCLMLGKGVRGNLASLMRWIDLGVPFPLGGVENRRSIMNVRNFADLILACLRRPEPLDGVYAASDGAVYSTPELLRRIAAALGRKVRLLPIPASYIRGLAKLLGQTSRAEKLLGDSYVDSKPLWDELAWKPVFSAEAAFQEMASAWRERGGKAPAG